MVTCTPLDFAQLHAEHGERMQAIARRITRNPRDAEDAAQEAWLKVWRTAPTFDGRNPHGWLSHAAWTCAIDVTRRADRRHSVPWGPLADLRAAVLPAPDDTEGEAIARLPDARVQEALAALAPGQRGALALVARGGTMEEGAAMHGITVGGFKALLSRARAAMRQRLDREG